MTSLRRTGHIVLVLSLVVFGLGTAGEGRADAAPPPLLLCHLTGVMKNIGVDWSWPHVKEAEQTLQDYGCWERKQNGNITSLGVWSHSCTAIGIYAIVLDESESIPPAVGVGSPLARQAASCTISVGFELFKVSVKGSGTLFITDDWSVNPTNGDAFRKVNKTGSRLITVPA